MMASCCPLKPSNPKYFLRASWSLVLSVIGGCCTSAVLLLLFSIYEITFNLNKSSDILVYARKALQTEGQAILDLTQYLDDEFSGAVTAMLNSSGRVVVTGIGKSAIIGQKLVATFNSTGQPAVFMHAADAIHGDLGMIQPGDVVIALSQSGNTPEIKVLIPLIKAYGYPVIAITGNKSSFLGLEADYVLQSTINEEACPLNLAPTTSSTAQLVLGDALAICLIRLRGFSDADFARFHPGGALGKKLYLRVADVSKYNASPFVLQEADLRTIILSITEGLLGCTAVTQPDGRILGLITDGDIRRTINQNINHLLQVRALNIMSEQPLSVKQDTMATEALEIMKSKDISQLVVTDEFGIYQGIIHLHDLIREGFI